MAKEATSASESLDEQGKDRIMEMGFKPVCFCGCVDAPITAVRAALKGKKLNPEDVESVRLIGIPKLMYYKWDHMVQAEFSTPCAIALAVTGYEPGPDWYTSGRYRDPEIFALASKVTFDEEDRARQLAVELGQWTCTAEIKTKDGKIRSAHIEHEKGVPENPMTEAEMHAKFMANARGILGPQAEQLWDSLMQLENVKKVSTVASKLSRKAQS